MNSGVLSFAGGLIRNTLTAVLPANTNFNGGTPSRASDGALCISSGPVVARSGGLAYNANGALCINPAGVGVGFVAGLPVDNTGSVLVDSNVAVASYTAGGLPLTANGRLALATAVA